MIYTDPLFLGVTPSGARNFVANKGLSLERPFFNACAGRFSVVEAAIKGGVPPQNVFASDIGLFSSIIGYLADPSKKLEDLGIRTVGDLAAVLVAPLPAVITLLRLLDKHPELLKDIV